MRFGVYHEHMEGRARAAVGMRRVALTSKVDRRLLFYLSVVVTSQRVPAGGAHRGKGGDVRPASKAEHAVARSHACAQQQRACAASTWHLTTFRV